MFQAVNLVLVPTNITCIGISIKLYRCIHNFLAMTRSFSPSSPHLLVRALMTTTYHNFMRSPYLFWSYDGFTYEHHHDCYACIFFYFYLDEDHNHFFHWLTAFSNNSSLTIIWPAQSFWPSHNVYHHYAMLNKIKPIVGTVMLPWEFLYTFSDCHSLYSLKLIY